MIIKPYGDTKNDGKVQISFSLPIDNNSSGVESAKRIAKQMGLIDPQVVSAEKLSNGFSFFVIYGSVPYSVDLNTLPKNEESSVKLSKEEVEQLIEKELKEEIVFIGASTGTDAHTVGIDAIMNMKGYAGHPGLERYKNIKTFNLGSQVPNETFVRKAKEVNADVLLVSQTVTQKDIHLNNLIELVEMLEAEGIRDKVLLIVGGARISNELAKELGYDAGFGQNKFAIDVATYAVTELIKRKNK